jgi:hypothetical protein
MKYYDYNEEYELRGESSDLKKLIKYVDEFGGFITDEYGKWVYGYDWLKEK